MTSGRPRSSRITHAMTPTMANTAIATMIKYFSLAHASEGHPEPEKAVQIVSHRRDRFPGTTVAQPRQHDSYLETTAPVTHRSSRFMYWSEPAFRSNQTLSVCRPGLRLAASDTFDQVFQSSVAGNVLFGGPRLAVEHEGAVRVAVPGAVAQRQVRRPADRVEREGHVLALRAPAADVRRVLRTRPPRLGVDVRVRRTGRDHENR